MSGIDTGYRLMGIITLASKPYTAQQQTEIYSTCFGGIGMPNCFTKSDDIPDSYNLPYYNDINLSNGKSFCTQCCGHPPDYTDVWDFSCGPITDGWATSLNSASYIGLEFRFARMNSLSDTDYVYCPLRRAGCTYDDKDTIDCDFNDDVNDHMIGYELYVEVEQYDINGEYWRGVSSCNATTITRGYPLGAGESFQQTFYLYHKPKFQPIDMLKGIVLGSLAAFIFMFLLVCCRKENCQVCQKRLIFTTNRCLYCRFLKARNPDPLLFQALEEKGRILQATDGRPLFPGYHICSAVLYAFTCCFSRKRVHPDRDSTYRNFQFEKDAKKLVTDPITIPVRPWIVYEAIHHPVFPPEIEQAREAARIKAEQRAAGKDINEVKEFDNDDEDSVGGSSVGSFISRGSSMVSGSLFSGKGSSVMVGSQMSASVTSQSKGKSSAGKSFDKSAQSSKRGSVMMSSMDKSMRSGNSVASGSTISGSIGSGSIGHGSHAGILTLSSTAGTRLSEGRSQNSTMMESMHSANFWVPPTFSFEEIIVNDPRFMASDDGSYDSRISSMLNSTGLSTMISKSSSINQSLPSRRGGSVISQLS